MDAHGDPIAIDPLTSPDFYWQDSGEEVSIPVNSVSGTSQFKGLIPFAKGGKFVTRVQENIDRGVDNYLQSRLKVVFKASHVQAGFKAAIALGSSVSVE